MPRKPQVRFSNAETRLLQWASPQQKEVFEYGPGPLCASGGFGASKTWAMAMKSLMLSDFFPKNRGVIVRRVFTELQKTTMATFYKLLPASAYQHGGRRNDQEKYLRLNNGSEVMFMHLDDPDVANVIKGIEINWFFIDQAEEVPEEIFDKLKSRLGRWDQTEVPLEVINREHEAGRKWSWFDTTGRPIPPTYAMIACNPDTKLHWIYRRFHPDSPEHWELRDDGRGGQTSYHLEGYKMVTMKSFDNRFLSDQNKAELATADESFRRRYVEGEWGNPEGQIHTITPASRVPGTKELVAHLLRTCTLHRSMDHGDTSPTSVGWWAVDRDGNAFLLAEYYQGKRLISQHRKELRAWDKEFGILVGIPDGLRYSLQLADPNIFTKAQQKNGGRFSVADDYSDAGISTADDTVYWQPADNNELVTRSRINEYLSVDPERVNPVTKEKGSPRLFFVTKSDDWPYGCVRSLSQTESQMRLKIGTELGKPVYGDERDPEIVDHAYDMVRYFCASRPPTAAVLTNRSSAGSFTSVRNNLVQFKKRGGFEKLAKMVHGRVRQRGF
jgi:hypothetical protein